VLVLIGLLAVFAADRGQSYYLDAALVLALVSFVATLALARFYDEGRPL
jgi:multicomponent Na+:H+ antiporter subunit F